jgi:hypothetical protein
MEQYLPDRIKVSSGEGRCNCSLQAVLTGIFAVMEIVQERCEQRVERFFTGFFRFGSARALDDAVSAGVRDTRRAKKNPCTVSQCGKNGRSGILFQLVPDAPAINVGGRRGGYRGKKLG